jgi:Phasin protein
MEFAKSNMEASFGFAHKLSDVKSPSDFLQLATEYSRKQFETLTEQTKDLTSVAQKVTLATVEPLKTRQQIFWPVNLALLLVWPRHSSTPASSHDAPVRSIPRRLWIIMRSM